MKRNLLLTVILMLVFTAVLVHAEDYQGKYIEEVRLEGLDTGNIPDYEIESILRTERGLYLSLRDVNEDVKDLFETKYFKDVQVEIIPSGDNVIVVYKFELKCC